MAHTWSPLTQCSCQHEKPSTLRLVFTSDGVGVGVGVGVVIRSVQDLKLLDLQFCVHTDSFCCPSIKLSAEFAVSEFRAMEQNFRFSRRSRSFSCHCSARLSAVKVWDIIENRTCAAIVHGFSKPQTF